MEPAIDPAIIDHLPRPLTLAQQAVLGLRERTGLVAFKYQLDVALALANGQDVLCIAGTGCGKSIAFILVLFICPDAILWILSPLNYIENQMAECYQKIGLAAVSVNASTLTPKLLKDITRGKYQVVISSPEAYHDANKLRPALLSKDLAHRTHITVVDEAHCVMTWGETGFCKVFQRIGDMRVFMPNPKNSPMCAATATCSGPVKHAILQSLHFKDNHTFINLGNWRSNLCYGVHIMNGGQKSYKEVNFFFDPNAQPFHELSQSMVFVETYTAAHCVALALRDHFGLWGEAARTGIAVYHSLLDDLTKRDREANFKSGHVRILVTTEALTMGADFPNVRLVLTYLAPETLEAWVQRAGRAGRSVHEEMCRCVMLVTKKMVENACKVCKDAGIAVDPTLASIKAEDDGGEEEDIPDVHPIDLGPTTNNLAHGRMPNKSRRSQKQLSLGVAEYIATVDCRTAVLDREFQNPQHTPCYNIGGCDRCVERRKRDEDADRHSQRRQLLKEEDQERQVEDFEHGTTERKKPAYQRNPSFRYGDLKVYFTEALLTWRKRKFLEVIEQYDISLERIMTEKELTTIAKTRGIDDPQVFDQAATFWPGPLEWRLEVLQVLREVQEQEDKRIAEEIARKEQVAQRKAEEKAERERQAAVAKAERERKAQERKLERECKAKELQAERERKAAERARKVAEDQAERERRVATEMATEQWRIQGANPSAAGNLLYFQLPMPQTPARPAGPRPVGSVRIGNGHPLGFNFSQIPNPLTPVIHPARSHAQNATTNPQYYFNSTVHLQQPLPTPPPSIPVPEPGPSQSQHLPFNPPTDQPTPSRPQQRRRPVPKPKPGEFTFVPYQHPGM